MTYRNRKLSAVWGAIGANESLLLKWVWPQGTPCTFAVFVNGKQVAKTMATQCNLSPALIGRRAAVSVLAVSEAEAAQDLSTLAYQPPFGRRAQLTVPAVDLATNPDFDSYQWYWSADGSTPTTLMAETRGANGNTITTPLLTDGTAYKFRAALRDIHGNLSAYGDTVTITANGFPVAPITPAISYNQSARTATITATVPSNQSADCVGYALYSNYLPGTGLQEGIVDLPLSVLSTGPLTYTTKELFPGHWLFEWRAVDATNLRSTGARAELSLAMSGSDLVSVTTPPAAPLSIDAWPIDGGKIKVRVAISNPNASNRVLVYRDGVYDGAVGQIANTYDYPFTTKALTDNTAYSFRAMNSNAQNVLISPENLNAAAWTKRGTTVTATDGPNAYQGWNVTLTYGLGDLYQFAEGLIQASRYDPEVWIRRHSTSGIMQIKNPNASIQIWQVDLSKLTDSWEFITRNHPAVSIIKEHASEASRGGFWVSAQSGTINIDLSMPASRYVEFDSSRSTGPASATADATAPTGDCTISAKLIE